MPPILRNISQWVDKKTGLAELPSSHRKMVRGEQLQDIADLLPAALLGCGAVGILILTVSWQSDLFLPAAAIFTIALAVQLVFCGFGSQPLILLPNAPPRAVGAKETRIYLLMAVVAAAVWGAMLNTFASSAQAAEHAFILGITVCASVLVSIYIFAPFVLGTIAFTLVSALSVCIALGPGLAATELVGLVVLLIGYVVVIPGMAMVNARSSVARISNEIRQSESSEQLGRRLMDYEESANEWFWETDVDGRIIKASDELLSALRINDKSRLETLKAVQHIASVAEHSTGDLQEFTKAVIAERPFRNIKLCINGNGGPVWIQISGKPVFSKSGRLTGYIGAGADITSEKLAESRIVEMAHYDSLTGLLNRSSFASRLESAVRNLERNGTPFMLMFLDLDKFKLVNDTFGHHTGDELLKMVAKRLSDIVRKGDYIARLGGDEFAILFDKTSDPVAAAKFASRLVDSVSKPYEFDTHFAVVGASIGVALAPEHGTRPEQLLRNADLALYRAKEDGRGLFRFFESRMDSEEREKRLLEVEMRTALEEDTFSMFFQPKVCTKTGRVLCFEALMRWDHEIRGFVSPEEFIPLAEQSNLIVDIGRWTLQKACEIAGDWPDDIAVAVNISATHFMRSDIVADVKDALKATGLEARRLEVEITESLMVADTADVAARLHKLKQLGVSIALDDFGTGYSSLSYLTKFPFDRLKIDKSFIQDIETDRNAKAIMRAISTLSEDLGIALTVEGVETKAQVEFLKTIYCDQFQGYYFSSAVPREDVAPYLLKRLVELDLKGTDGLPNQTKLAG